MTHFLTASVAPLSPSFLARVRAEGRDDLDQPPKAVIAQGGEPCRDVLRRARPGERLLLASHSPFAQAGPYKEYGPVFVLAEESDETVRRDGVQAGGDTDYLRGQFVIRAYSHAQEIVDAALVRAEESQAVIERFFEREDVAFLHARFPTYGCFACRLERPLLHNRS